MKLQIHSVHFDADKKLLDFIQKKLDKLETFYDSITSGEVYLRLQKDGDSKENKVVEVKLFVPGGSIFTKEQSTSFEAATDLATEALKTQIKKHKEKLVERQQA
ncbi:putative sigma-54 modulation protein [Flexibacter flexilis DSM 6793]|uniref:Putative sigma-54 modulation protein n=1 Tax=Flexibacter flexilis DSM 6793 TaxID=927664 RepID=A0A1I1J3S1_9BACT|nr:ribosome-associated translation inhibitor RaiA [Flexibacter flexilis]SFC40100.1 putative sigma-54 modulation protein [Flexibacter flexilis DSM 6793]